jgi:DNA-binding transcriptional MerR regulator
VGKVMDGQSFFFAHEAAKMAGISKATLLRWVEQQLIRDAERRDRNGWRLFSEAEVEAIIRVARGEGSGGSR